MKKVQALNHFVPLMNVTLSLMKAKKAKLITNVQKNPDRSDYFQKIIYYLYRECGLSEASRVEMKLAVHGFHELFDTIATALLWSPRGRTEMGRWVFQVNEHGVRCASKGEAKVIFARYATAVSNRIQIKLRTNIIYAVRNIVLERMNWQELPMDQTLACVVDSPFLAECEYYGPAGHH